MFVVYICPGCRYEPISTECYASRPAPHLHLGHDFRGLFLFRSHRSTFNTRPMCIVVMMPTDIPNSSKNCPTSYRPTPVTEAFPSTTTDATGLPGS